MGFGAIFLQASSNPLPYHLNKMAGNVTFYVPFETVKARQRPGQTTKLASVTEKDRDEENSEKRSWLFHCAEEECGKSFQQCSSFKKQLDEASNEASDEDFCSSASNHVSIQSYEK